MRLFPAIQVVSGVLAFFAATSLYADPTAYSYNENFNLFGDQANMSCNLKNGSSTFICGAVAAINSFIFLENMYPGVYAPGGTDLLTPNYNLLNNNSPTDAANFAANGFGTYEGYYNRPGSATGDYIQTLSDWFTQYSPNNTVLNSWYTGSTGNDELPTVSAMANELKDGEDIEFFVQDSDNPNFFHVVTLTGISCNDIDDLGDGCTIDYQDPNAPLVNQSAALTYTGSGLQFTGLPGSNYNGTVTITAMFSESPAPEPETFALLGLGLVAGLAYFSRRKLPTTIASMPEE